MKARARIVARPDGVVVLRSEPPLALRETPDAVFLVGTAAGPIGGDDVLLEIEVCAGAELTIRSAAASVALPGPTGAPSRFTVRARVEGTLRWLPEPGIAARGCNHINDVRLQVARGGVVTWREEVVLGRDGEEPGSWTTRLSADFADQPLLRQTLEIGAEGWDGPAVAGEAGAIGSILVVGEPLQGARADEGYASMPLAGGGVLVSAVAPNALILRERLARATSDAVLSRS
jgi:urease accessory protein